MQSSPYSNDEYTVGWISALNDEFIVAMAMLDEEHGRPQSTPREDTNAYHLGRIGSHNVAMASVSGGQMGTGPAAVAAENMRRTFKNIRFALLVGIGGGVPGGEEREKDVRLGDVVVSYPERTYTGVVQYDYGKLMANGEVERKDWFCGPPRKLLATVDILRAYHERPKNPINSMHSIMDELGVDYAYPESVPDCLYRAEYEHVAGAQTCEACDESARVKREERQCPSKPRIHYGTIASGNLVIKSGIARGKIDQRYSGSILCFEMEAAGLMNNFPCLVIRGICDYCDSHKNDRWRKRAIAVSSAYAKELLSLIEPADVEVLPPMAARVLTAVSQDLARVNDGIAESLGLLKKVEHGSQLKDLEDRRILCERWLKPPNVREFQQDTVRNKLPQTCDWIWSNKVFLEWNSAPSSGLAGLLCICGPPGCGKSVLASSMTDHMMQNSAQRVLFFAFSRMHTRQQKPSDMLRSLIWQLLEVGPKNQALSMLHEPMQRGQPTTSDLWKAFHDIASLVSDPVYCLIDGADEGKGDVAGLIQRLRIFLQDHFNFRFIMFGRQSAFHGVSAVQHRIEIEPGLVKSDIEKAIKHGIAHSDAINTPQLEQEVLSALRKHANGNFLWVKLMMAHLGKSVGTVDTRKRLRNLPKDLQWFYEDLFMSLIHTLDPSELTAAQKIFAYLLVSRCPLSVEEFRYLLAADAMSTASSEDSSIEDYLMPALNRRIFQICGGIVGIKNGYLHLVHSSVMDFLIRPESEWESRRKNRKIMRGFRVDIKKAHGSLAEACMAYLEAVYVALQTETSSGMIRDQPLAEYALQSVLYHVNRSDFEKNYILKRTEEILGSPALMTIVHETAMMIMEDESLDFLMDEFDDFVSTLGNGSEYAKVAGKAMMVLKGEHERLSQEYGEFDWRPERIRMFQAFLSRDDANIDLDTTHPMDIAPRNSMMGLTEVAPMLHILQDERALISSRKLDLFLRLNVNLVKFRQLTDPIQIILRMIMQKAEMVPTYVLLQVGYYYQNLRKHDQAIKAFRLVIQKLNGKDVALKYLAYRSMGREYYLQHQFQESLDPYSLALSGFERLLGAETWDTLATVQMIGISLVDLKRYDEAFTYFDRALAGFEKVYGPMYYLSLWVVHHMGAAYVLMGQYERALAPMHRALAGQKEVIGAHNKDTLRSDYWLAMAYKGMEQYDIALEYFREALEGQEKVLGPKHSHTLDSLERIGEVYQSRGEFDQAMEFFNRAKREKTLARGP